MSDQTFTDTAQTFAADAMAQGQQAAEQAQETLKTQMEKVSKGFEDMTAFGQENVDAMIKSGDIVAKSAETINAEVVAYTKQAFEASVAAAKDMAAAKNMTELFEKQTAFAQSSVDMMVKQAQKMNEMFVAAAKDMVEPINARMAAAQDVVKTATQH